MKLVMHFNYWSDGLDKCVSGLPSEREMRSELGAILLQIHTFKWRGSLLTSCESGR